MVCRARQLRDTEPSSMTRSLHDGRQDGLEPLESLDIRGAEGLADLLERMARTAFGGRELGEAFAVLRAMADDRECTRVVTVSGAMTVGKMGRVLCEMIDAGLAQILVCTGAVMAHGLSEAIGCTHYKHDPRLGDKQLYDWGYNRVYDTLEMEANFWQAQELVSEVLSGWDWSRPACSWQINRELGRKLVEKGQMPSILGCAFRRDVPVYVPAMTDSELGLDVATFCLGQGYRPGDEADLEAFFSRVPSFNPFLDLCDYARRIQARGGSVSSPSAAACPAIGRSRPAPSATSSTCAWGPSCRCRASATACGSARSPCIGAA